jgi:K+-transporting ATPase ATPase A chain
MDMLYALAAPIVILPFVAVSTKAGLSALTTNAGPHRFTGILFAYTSCFANNGQNFAGLSVNTPIYKFDTAVAMMVGRFGVAIPASALPSLLGRQRNTPNSSGTLRSAAYRLFSNLDGARLSTGTSAWSSIRASAIRKLT